MMTQRTQLINLRLFAGEIIDAPGVPGYVSARRLDGENTTKDPIF